MFKLILLLIVFVVLLFLIEKLVAYFSKLNIVAKWLLFLPISSIRSLFCGMIISVLFGGIFPINNNILLAIMWSLSPIVFLFTTSKTMPKGARITTNILRVLWILGSMYEIIVQSEHYAIRIVQILAMLVYLYFQNNSWNSAKKRESVLEVGE